MIDLYLKANNEQALINAMPSFRLDGEWLYSSHYYALTIMGILYNDDGVYDELGEVVTPATIINGFHANLRCTPEIADSTPSEIQILRPNNLKVRWFDE